MRKDNRKIPRQSSVDKRQAFPNLRLAYQRETCNCVAAIDRTMSALLMLSLLLLHLSISTTESDLTTVSNAGHRCVYQQCSLSAAVSIVQHLADVRISGPHFECVTVEIDHSANRLELELKRKRK